MEATRVVAVQQPGGSAGPGSGYVIAPRLVLTSAHVVPARGAAVQVLVAADPVTYAGVVVWRGTPGGRDDAALVEVDDPAWRPRRGRVRWGRVVTDRPGTDAQAWGFPAFVQRPGRAAETEQPSGTLNPGDRYVGDRYVLTLTGTPPAPTGDGSSPWGGLSGAALFCDDLLAGVVAADPAGVQHARIEAVPTYLLHRDDGFRSALAGHGLGEMVLEPVELQQLIETEPDPVRAPASLLRARHQMVPFRGRERLLEDLSGWAQGPGFAACLLHGPGGQGKTRLAHELARRLGDQRWAWLWLGRDTPVEDLAVLGDAAVPLLVIVDYAEARPGQVTAACRAAARHAGTAPLRMLLLARTAGDWWDGLRASDPYTEELLDGAPVARLDPLESDPEGQAEAYREAVHALAAALPAVPGQDRHDWSAIAARLTGRTPAPWGGPVPALTLHMTALADLLDTADLLGTAGPQDPAPRDHGGGFARPGPGPVEDRLLRHERRYWTYGAGRFGLLPPVLGEPTLDDALTAAFLLGATDTAGADAVLARIPALSDQTQDRRDAVRRWIAHLYPSPDTTRPWDSLQPDRLAERFVGKQLTAHPALADHLTAGADPAQATQLLTVYARAAHHPAASGRLGPALTALCVRHPATLAAPAIQVATHVEAPGPLIAALRHLARDPDTPQTLLQTLVGSLPRTSHRLADAAAELTGRLTDIHRRRATDDHALEPDLALSLNNLGNRLSDLGRREDALTATGEAVEIRRRLAARWPDVYRDDLRSSLDLFDQLERGDRPGDDGPPGGQRGKE